MIKAVSFDFWLTLVTIDKEIDARVNQVRKNGIERLFNHYGIPIDPEQIIPKMLHAKKNIIQNKKEQGFVDFSSRDIQIPYVFEHMAPEIPLTISRAKPILKEHVLDSFFEIITRSLLKHKPPLIQNVDLAIKYVKENGLKAGIVSNTGLTNGNTLREVLEYYNLLHYFDSTQFSDEAELMKPNPKFFQVLADDLGLKSSEILHVGDTIYADINGSREAGYHEGILFLGAFDDEYQYRNLEEDYQYYKPKYIIDDYRDFPKVFAAIQEGRSEFIIIHNQIMKHRLGL
jgi:FMN phosphatase YigB (HAD superfamily)